MQPVLRIPTTRHAPVWSLPALVAAMVIASCPVRADEAVPLARELADPLSRTGHIDLYLDWDEQLGGFDEGERRTVTARSHIAFATAAASRVVWRMELPFIRQQGLAPGNSLDSDVSGIGDLSTSVVYMPAAVSGRALQWGIGLAARLPTASRDGLGQDDGALGPALVARWTGERWSTGLQLLHEQAWGDDENVTRVLPFVARDLGRAWSVGIDVDARYDWGRHSLKGPMTVYVRRAGGAWAFDAGARYWPDGATPEPEWGLRLGATWAFD